MQKPIIVFSPKGRTGSHYAAQYLIDQKQLDIKNSFEPFQPNLLWFKINDSYVAHRFLAGDPTNVKNNLRLIHNLMTAEKTFVIRIFLDHLRFQNHLLYFLDQLDSFTLVVLRRRNLVDHFTSHFISSTTGLWIASPDEWNKANTHIQFSDYQDHCRSFFNSINRFEQLLKFFTPDCEFFYEDLLDSYNTDSIPRSPDKSRWRNLDHQKIQQEIRCQFQNFSFFDRGYFID